MTEREGVDRARVIEAAWRRERPDLDPSSIGVVTRIWHLAKVFGDERRRLLASHGVEPALMDLLGSLRRAGAPFELTTRDLAERSLVTPAAISQRLARAEAAGWVTRRPGPSRTVVVALTDAGCRLVDGVAGAIFEHESALIDVLGPEQQHQLAGHLATLIEAIAPDGPIPHVGDHVQRH